MKRKYVKLVAAVLMAALLMAGCGSPGTESPGNSGAVQRKEEDNTQTAERTGTKEDIWESDPVLNDPGMEPIEKEPVTVKVVTGYDDWDDNWSVGQMKERLGVEFEWVVVPPEQFKEKLNLMLAGGETIDLVLFPLGAGSRQVISKAEEFKFAQQGLLTPLNDYIEHSSKYIKEYYDAHPEFYQDTTTPDGNIYSFQSANPAYHVSMPYKLWINTQWLNNVGMDMPTTTEEFYEVLKAFKEQDANGNGDPDDEVPFPPVQAEQER